MLSQSSIKVQVLVIINALSQLPSIIVSVKVAFNAVEQLSASSVTSPVKNISFTSTSHSMVISAGTVNVGAVVSLNVIVCVNSVELLQSSVNVQVKVMVILQGLLPSVIITGDTVRSPEQLSEAVKSMLVGKSLVHSSTISSGAAGAIGAVVSSTIIV